MSYERLVAEERLILEATEAICEQMEKSSDLTRKALAERLGKSKGYVTQILSGERNMTLRTLTQFDGDFTVAAFGDPERGSVRVDLSRGTEDLVGHTWGEELDDGKFRCGELDLVGGEGGEGRGR